MTTLCGYAHSRWISPRPRGPALDQGPAADPKRGPRALRRELGVVRGLSGDLDGPRRKKRGWSRRGRRCPQEPHRGGHACHGAGCVRRSRIGIRGTRWEVPTPSRSPSRTGAVMGAGRGTETQTGVVMESRSVARTPGRPPARPDRGVIPVGSGGHGREPPLLDPRDVDGGNAVDEPRIRTVDVRT
jgi:hypothetical protein